MAIDAWNETKEQVRQASDIVDVVGSYAQLRHQGREYVALCPWHDDTRPSLHVNPERQSYKCFVCDVGGDVFSFIMQIEGVSFRESLEMLAERAGIALAARQTRRGEPQAGTSEDKQALYRAMAWAEAQYHECLVEAAEAEPARRYLDERGISRASIEKFRIGFVPQGWDWLLKRAAETPFTPKILEKIGLVMPRSSGEGYYDRFRGRVMFSIRDAQSREARPVAMGGRILPELTTEDTAKYINSPETPLFSKNRQLYGLDIARDAIARQRRAVVVEGYTDCVIAHQAGVENVVAVLGTALGERHIGLLRRFADTVTLVLDGDEAGRRRANEILSLFVAAQVDLQILTLPENLDPCDFLIAHGSEAFGRLIEQAPGALEHKIETETQGLDLAVDTHQANEALERILGTIAAAPRLASNSPASGRLREEQVLSRLAQRFYVSEEQLRKRMTELRRRAQRPMAQTTSHGSIGPPKLSDVSFWDRELLELVICEPAAWWRIAEVAEPDDIESDVCRQIYATGLQILGSDVAPDFDRLMLEFEDPVIKSYLVQLEEQSRRKAGSDLEMRLAEVINSFRCRKEDARLRSKSAALRRGEFDAEQEKDLNELMQALKARQTGSEPTDG